MTTPFPFVASSVLEASQLNAITTLPIATKTANYVAVVGDVGKRIVMNMAGANTITINNSIFAEGDTIFLANKGAGATTITAGAGVTINTAGSLELAQYGGGTLVALSASVFNFFTPSEGVGYGVATGGTSYSVTVGGEAYTLLQFTSDNNLVVTSEGLFDVLLVAGGAGASGGSSGQPSGGAGGGGVVGLTTTCTIFLPAATYAVDIGAGGAGGATDAQGANGLGSDIGVGNISATGGGYSGGLIFGVHAFNGTGASTGGTTASFVPVGVCVPDQGNIGGTGTAAGCGGGGGAGSVGATISAGTIGGQGGHGLDIYPFANSISVLTNPYYAGAGGGGGGSTGGAAGNGGVAGKSTGTGNAGVNYGAAGGGTRGAATGGAGSAGLVLVRFKI